MPARLVELPQGDHVPALAAHFRGLIDTGHWILLSTSRTPGAELLSRLPALGVDVGKLVIVDSGTPKGEQLASPDPRHLMYVPGPQLLELLTLRSEKVIWARRKEKTHVVIHDINTFAKHSTPEAIEQMLRYILARVRSYTTVDLCVDPHAEMPASLRSSLHALCDQHLALEPPA